MIANTLFSFEVSFASTIPGQYVGSQVMQWFSNIHMYKNILKYSLKSYFHEHWLVSINLPFCFALLLMTFAINIETKYRIQVILNNEKKLFQGTIKQLQGTLQAVPITRISTIIPFIGNNTKNKNHKETGNNKRGGQ